METSEENLRPWCSACGYSLHGLPESGDKCPECGGAIAENAIDFPQSIYRSLLIDGCFRRLLLSIPLALFAGCLAAPFEQHRDTDHHCWRPKSQESAKHPKYLSFHFYTPKTCIVFGFVLGLPIMTSRGPVDFWLQMVSGVSARIKLDPRSLAYRYMDRSGKSCEGASFDEKALSAWTADAGVNLTSDAEREEARVVIEYLRTVTKGHYYQARPPAFGSYFSHSPVGSHRSQPTLLTLAATLLYLLVIWWLWCRHYRRALLTQVRLGGSRRAAP